MENEKLKKLLKNQIHKTDKIGYPPNIASPKEKHEYSRLTSNKTGESIEPDFDFGSLTSRDKKLIEEVIKLLKTNDNSTVQNVTKQIKEKFKIDEIPMMKYENSLWYELTKNENLGVSIQGYREITNSDGTKIRIPHVAMSADLDYLDDVVKRIFSTVRNLVIK
jgi:hypothetical protein